MCARVIKVILTLNQEENTLNTTSIFELCNNFLLAMQYFRLVNLAFWRLPLYQL